MKHWKPWLALILIALLLLPSAEHVSASGVPSSGPSATPAGPGPAEKAHAVTVDKPYNYYGTFSYAAPANPPEGRWRIAGEIATVLTAVLVAILAGLVWDFGRKQKKLAEAAETIARESVELTTLVAGLLRDLSPKQKETAEAVKTIARQSIEVTTLAAGLLQNFSRKQNDIADAAQTIARQSVELTTLATGLLGDFSRQQKELAEAAEASARRSVERTALAAGWLADFSRKQNEIAEAAQTTARQSIEVTTLALNAERPYLFVEEQEIEMSLPLPTTLAARTMGENIALEPLRYAGAGSSNVANIMLRFMLRNRGKGIGIVRRIRVRMLLGRGAVKNTDSKLTTVSTADGSTRATVIGGGEQAECFCFGLRLPLQTLDEVRQFNLSLRFVIVVSHADVFRRPLVTTFPFEYRPPIRSPHFDGSPDYPSMLLPVLKVRRSRLR